MSAENCKAIEDVCRATRAGDLHNVKNLLSDHPYIINETDEFNNTPLYLACLCGHKEIVQHLLLSGSCLVSGTAEADRCIKAAQDSEVRTLLKHFLSEPFKFLSPDGRGGLTPYFCFLDWMYNTMTEADIILRITDENLNSDTNNENVGILDNVNGNDNTGNENTSSQDKSWFLQLDNCEVEEKHLDIRAHKAILVVRCPFFKDLLLQGNQNSRIIYLSQFGSSAHVLPSFIRYIYTGLFEAESNDTELLKDIATKLQLHELANDIEKRRGCSAGKKKNKNKNQKLYIRGPSHSEKLKEDFTSFVSSGIPQKYHMTERIMTLDPADVSHLGGQLICSVKAVRFTCVKAFLHQSGYFKNILTNIDKTLVSHDSSPLITVDVVQPEIFATFLEFLYTESIPKVLSLDTILELLRSSIVFQVPHLTRVCCERLHNLLSVPTVPHMLETSLGLNLHVLSCVCYTFIAKNIIQVAENDDFIELLSHGHTQHDNNNSKSQPFKPGLMTRLLPYVQQIEGSQTPRMSESNSVIQMLQMKYGNTDQDVTSQEPAQDPIQETKEKNILDYVAQDDLNAAKENKPESQDEESGTKVEDVDEEKIETFQEESGSDTGLFTEGDMKTDITLVKETTVEEVKTDSETLTCVPKVEDNKSDKETDNQPMDDKSEKGNNGIIKEGNGEGVVIEAGENSKINAMERAESQPDTCVPTFAETLWQNCLDERPPSQTPRSLLADKQTPHKYDRYINGLPKNSVSSQSVSQVEPGTHAAKNPGSHKSQCCVIL